MEIQPPLHRWSAEITQAKLHRHHNNQINKANHHNGNINKIRKEDRIWLHQTRKERTCTIDLEKALVAATAAPNNSGPMSKVTTNNPATA